MGAGSGRLGGKGKGASPQIVMPMRMRATSSVSRSSSSSSYGVGGFSLRGSGSGGGGVAASNPALGGLSGTTAKAQDIHVSGSLSRGPIQKVIRSHLTQIKRLYEQQLKKNPNLVGKVVLTFVIAADGTVKSVKVTNTTVGDEAFEKALMKIVKKWKFPKPVGGGEVMVSYPFIFEKAL